ncbi:hypothetical protein [Catenuloplanes indicus]|uniref:Uncharacterized protein n=1 Tax=Catenuloplanes indicus TaxID=137267 RepID=A0AAE3W664_9ACTN|nr:hypothetical protein [Catenuloplanes indicus]MDQ0370010.1 hypothetical protein [Catenuloplanes indicus]
MTLPLTQRVMDAICLDHIIPTGSGLHLRRDGMAALTDDPLMLAAFDVIAPDGNTYITLGKGMTEAFDDLAPDSARVGDDGVRAPGGAGTHAQRVARGLLYQFLNGHPDYALDRMVERPLGDHDLNLTAAAARADVAGLPVDILATADLSGVDRNRLIGFSRDLRIVPIDQAQIIRVVPLRHWAPDPYAGQGKELLDSVLSTPYPSARITFDGQGGVRLGLPPALVAHAYGEVLRRTGTPLDARDFPKTSQLIQGYGDLLAAIADSPVGAHTMIQVGDQVTLALHDAHGMSFVDPATGQETVFAADPADPIRIAPLGGEMDLETRLLDLAAGRPGGDGPRLPVRVSGAADVYRDFGGSRTLDVIGGVPSRFMDRIAEAASRLDQSVVVIGSERLSDAPTPAELAALDWQLFQHTNNRGVPVVITRGTVSDGLRRIVEHYRVPLLHQTAGTGTGFSLDNLWAGVGGATTVPPAKEITADLLAAYAGRRRVSTLDKAPAALSSFLTTPLENADAIRAALAEHGSALRDLRPEITKFGATAGVFAAHAAFLNVLDRDPVFADTLLTYRAGGDDRADGLFAAVPAVATQEPAVRDAAFAEIDAITLGTLDDGASRAILKALHLHLQGAPEGTVRDMIYSHSTYLPRDGRTQWIRRLQDLQRQMPQHADGLNQVALFVTTCP